MARSGRQRDTGFFEAKVATVIPLGTLTARDEPF
jgi:hypothetical protein